MVVLILKNNTRYFRETNQSTFISNKLYLLLFSNEREMNKNKNKMRWRK